MGLWEYRAAPLRVIDGDTIELLIDNGFNSRQQESIRLIDVYAPESKDLGGAETKAYVEQWLHTNAPTSLRWPLYVYTYPTNTIEPTERRTFTRYLGEIWNIGQTLSLNAAVKAYLATNPQYGPGNT